mmetsp:Transcript_31189/g.85505  ORF Transcript_31189/g.85505 Transcript_31189/m.85505 type:complete len:278 (+) Transcript_31189:142-975(+)
MALAAGTIPTTSVEGSAARGFPRRDVSAASHLAKASGRGHALAPGVVSEAQCAPPATRRQGPPFRVDTRCYLPPATSLAETGADLRSIYVAAQPVVAETQHATTATRRERLARPCMPRRHATAATPATKALGNLEVADVLLERVEARLPIRAAKLVHRLSLHPFPLLVQPGEAPAMLFAERLKPPFLVRVSTVSRISNEALDVPCEGDLAVDLRLLVLHLSYLRRITKKRSIRGGCDLQRLGQFRVAVLVKDVGVKIQNRKFIRLHIRRIFRRERAP